MKCVEYRTNRIRESDVNAHRYKLDEKDFQENSIQIECESAESYEIATVANERLETKADLSELNHPEARSGPDSKSPSETGTETESVATKDMQEKREERMMILLIHILRASGTSYQGSKSLSITSTRLAIMLGT